MTVDFKAEVEKRWDDLLADLKTVLAVPSVRDDSQATEDAPLGPGPRDALLKFLEIFERDGFKTKNVDNLAGYLEYGEGDEMLGIIGHVDVVPVGDGWDSDPFTPVIKDNRIYARGSSDDKGPTMAAYYGLKIIKELGLPVSKRIRLILGTDEETGWTGMTHYLETEETPDFGFSPDAEFPIINGEKGNMVMNIHTKGANDGAYQLIKFDAGMRPNMVPDLAVAMVQFPEEETDALVDAFGAFLDESPVTGKIDIDDNIATITVNGKAAHGAKPNTGINAATFLATFLAKYDFNGAARDYLGIITDLLHEQPFADKLGLKECDENMGDLTMNVGIFKFDQESEDNTINLNFRFPTGTDERIANQVGEKVAPYHATVNLEPGTHVPHYVPGDDPLVQTLLDVYHEHTGLPAHEQVIGGGTFGRLLERGVAYGAMFPNSIDTMHQPNEFMDLDDLFRSAVIYADAIYRLAK